MKKAPGNTYVQIGEEVRTLLGPNGLNYVVALALDKTGGEPCRRVNVLDEKNGEVKLVQTGRQCRWHGHHLFYYVKEIKGQTCVSIHLFSELIKAIKRDEAK